MTVIVSLSTPFAVAPPFFPSKNGTHGGESGSSVWRGGLPTQFFGRGLNSGNGGGGTRGSAPIPSPPAPMPEDEAVLVWLKFADAAASCFPGTGAYSALALGLVWGTLRGLGSTRKTST